MKEVDEKNIFEHCEKCAKIFNLYSSWGEAIIKALYNAAFRTQRDDQCLMERGRLMQIKSTNVRKELNVEIMNKSIAKNVERQKVISKKVDIIKQEKKK